MQERYGKLQLEDPFSALNRDAQEASEEVHDNSPVYASAMVHLEALISQQKKTHQKMMIQMTAAEKRHKKVVHELEEEKRKHAQDTAQGDDVTYMLEKERERLSQQVDFEKSQLRKMEKDKNKAVAMLEEERAHHQQIGVLLAKERKRLASKLIQERQQLKDAHKGLQDEKDKVRNMAEGLVQESKKSLKMEAEMEKQLSEFDIEREQLRSKLSREEAKNRDLQTEVDEYRKQLEDMRKSLLKGAASGDVVKPRAILRSAGTQTENPPENEVRRREGVGAAAESKNYVSTVKQNLLRSAENTDAAEKATTTKETRKTSPWLKNAPDKPVVSAWGPNPFPCASVETEHHHGKADLESSSDSEDDKTVIENVPPVSFKAGMVASSTGQGSPSQTSSTLSPYSRVQSTKLLFSPKGSTRSTSSSSSPSSSSSTSPSPESPNTSSVTSVGGAGSMVTKAVFKFSGDQQDSTGRTHLKGYGTAGSPTLKISNADSELAITESQSKAAERSPDAKVTSPPAKALGSLVVSPTSVSPGARRLPGKGPPPIPKKPLHIPQPNPALKDGRNSPGVGMKLEVRKQAVAAPIKSVATTPPTPKSGYSRGSSGSSGSSTSDSDNSPNSPHPVTPGSARVGQRYGTPLSNVAYNRHAGVRSPTANNNNRPSSLASAANNKSGSVSHSSSQSAPSSQTASNQSEAAETTSKKTSQVGADPSPSNAAAPPIHDDFSSDMAEIHQLLTEMMADGTSGMTGERGPASPRSSEMSNCPPSQLSPSDSPTRKLSTLKIEIGGGGGKLDARRREKHTTSNFLYLPAEKESQCFESSSDNDDNNTVPNDNAKSTDAKHSDSSNNDEKNNGAPQKTAEADTVEGEVAELCKTLLKKGGLGEETPVRGIPNRLHQAAGEGDVTMVEQLLEEGADPNTTERDGSTPVYAAAEGGHLDCLELLLSHNGDPNSLRDDNFTPLHGAAAEGHTGCLKLLLERGAHPGLPDKAGWSPLYWAVSNGHTDCCSTLLDYFASRAAVTDVGWTPLHGACRSGHVSCLKVLLYYDPLASDIQDQASPLTARPALVSKDVINAVDRDGWTAAHVAASRGFKDCLELLCGHPELDLTIRDKWDRLVQDVAVGDCQGLVEDIGKRKVSVVIDTSSEPLAPARTPPTPAGKEEDLYVLGCLTLERGTDWSQFDADVGAVLVQNSKKLSVASELLTDVEEVDADISADGHVSELGLTANSIRSYTYGTISWSPATEFDTPPYDFFTAKKHLAIRLKGPDEDCVDKLAYESMIPVQTLQNYLRLIEQYKSVVFYGPPGTGKTFIVRKLAECIRHKQQQGGVQADISHVALSPKYTHRDLLQLLRSKGFLLPADSATSAEGPQKAPILILDDLGRVSLSEVLGELLYALEYRGPQHPISMKIDEEGPKDDDGSSSGAYFLSEDCYIIGTMDKSHSPGLDLSVQQRFRWVHLKCDSEPVRGLLQRHLRRRLISAHGGQLPSTEDQVYKAVEWVAAVWQRLNACLAKLGLPDLVLGPRHFFTCPIEATKVKAILRWLSLSWNHAIAPGVEDAMLRGLSSQNQQKLASTALSVLLQRAVIPGCPLSGQEAERYLSSFRGGYEGMVSLLNTAKRSAARAKRSRSAQKRNGSGKDSDSQDSDSSTAAEGDSGVDSPDSPLSPTGPPGSTLTGSPGKKRPTSELARRVIENLHASHHASSPDLRSASLSNLAYLGASSMDGDVLKMLLKMQTSKSESNLNTVIELHDHIFNMHSRGGTIKRRPKVKASSQTQPKEVKRESSEEEDNPETKDKDGSDDKEPLQFQTDQTEGTVGDEVWSLRQDLQ
ncbi:PREDICTED: cortactin-binding protein 2-like [Branchiostoma belcheri]|uniref:Cortactin-binding protein 2 n=1 Tax=Branchiostoma belcheri TaxID=7741 RepID=A0A6P4YUZ8_BRABE|nr:PREDICTED: cortactin-binding protein 2-like [Branchiostoma belcheri]